nr:MAG TPA: hypothetical protein [Caudoviricetes sp.]
MYSFLNKFDMIHFPIEILQKNKREKITINKHKPENLPLSGLLNNNNNFFISSIYFQ